MSLVPLTDLIMMILQTYMLFSIVTGCEKKTDLFVEKQPGVVTDCNM